ncbi:hypothetical protein [Peterkaempfera sp. SMS 1(5)a]|uniref:hypothetical protein n=1 Tax=Peterkaempfera podocarpi TaxID=3232308 RepID=UPI00366C9FDA
MTALVIARRFNGPADSANGGYACGTFAERASGAHGPAVAVTLLEPPPLDTPLGFDPGERRSRVRQHDRLIATVTAAARRPPALPPTSSPAVAAAEADFRGAAGHPFRSCFVCGVDRTPGDGLCLTPGRIPGAGPSVACRWTVEESVCDEGGEALPPILWAVLDCPGGWTADPAREPMVLSRMSTWIDARPRCGDRCVVSARQLRRDGRTATNISALHTEDGRLLASATAVWTAVRRPEGNPQ